jgi:hypothetical protein
MDVKTAEAILLSKKPHAAECNRHETGRFDASGRCERCSAFLAKNRALIG